MKNKIFTLTLLLAVLASCTTPEQNETTSYKLWYDEPARYFEEALVLGNGQMGATVFGGMHTDSIYLNESTLWSGEPVDPDMNPEAHTWLPAIREALSEGDYGLGNRLNKNIQGSFSQSYAPLGTLYLNFGHGGSGDYYRELDLDRARATVSYPSGDNHFTREYAVSHPDRVMIIRLSSEKEGGLNLSLGFSSLLCHEISGEAGILKAEGYAPWHAEPSYRGDMPDAIRFDPDRGTRFASLISVKECDGNSEYRDGKLHISGATEAVLLVSSATSFNGFDRDPATDGADHLALALGQLDRAMGKSTKALFEAQEKDHQSFFNRLSFHLEKDSIPQLPTDERLIRYAEGGQDPYLEELYLQFGRYLFISSSRTPEVPANLQGIWNPYLRPPWSSNYTTNINVEENYWLAETANLGELHTPLLGFISNLAETGKISARNFYGVQEGWSVSHNSDIWAMSNPVGDFGQGGTAWANWNMAGTWLSTHLWEHYLFSQDEAYLEKEAWPLMKGAAQFCLHWLIEGPDGTLITSPSTSPENTFLTPEGYRGSTLYGATCDLAMMRELFIACIRASEILDTDREFAAELAKSMENMHPYQVGRHGHLQEWYHDFEDFDPQHRHQTHLFGLYPGTHITPEATPELAAACRRTLEIKGERSTGWAQGWRINLWARLKDGERAYSMYRQLLRFVDPSGLHTEYTNSGGTYPNLLDAHPPYQIDGNFGGAAGVLEMLVQSSEDRIELLPALPKAWPSGQLHGVRARGGFELDLDWKEGRLSSCVIRSEKGGNTTLAFRESKRALELGAGEELRLEDW